MSVTRRSFFARAGAIAAAQGLALKGQQTPPEKRADPRLGTADAAKYFQYSDRRSKVSLIKGENRRKNIYDALVAIDDQIRPALKAKKYIFLKPNGIQSAERMLAATQARCRPRDPRLPGSPFQRSRGVRRYRGGSRQSGL